jgi:hypothetical protein
MATPTQVQVHINPNMPFTPELLYSIKTTLDEKYSVDCLMLPNPNTTAAIQAEGDADAATLRSIEGDTTMALMQAASAPKGE